MTVSVRRLYTNSDDVPPDLVKEYFGIENMVFKIDFYLN